MNYSFRVFVLLVVALGATTADVCDLEKWEETNMTSVCRCVKAVPYDPIAAIATIKTLEAVIGMYVFSDICADSKSPYFIKVDLWEGLKNIRNTRYQSEIDFHIDIVNLFGELHDPHTQYTAPRGFNAMQIQRFGLNTKVPAG